MITGTEHNGSYDHLPEYLFPDLFINQPLHSESADQVHNHQAKIQDPLDGDRYFRCSSGEGSDEQSIAKQRFLFFVCIDSYPFPINCLK